MSAEDRERIEAIEQRLIDGGCEHEVESCREQCDTFAEYCLPCQASWLLNLVTSLRRKNETLRNAWETSEKDRLAALAKP